MMKRIGLVVLLAACNSGGDEAAARLEGNFTGNWAGDTGGGGTLSATFALVDSGDVMGTVSLTGSPCLPAATMTLQIDGDDVTGDAVSGNTDAQLQATFDDPDLAGSFQLDAPGACSGATGTFDMVKQ